MKQIHAPFGKLNMGVYYLAGTQECCSLLHFCSSLIPLLLSLNVK